MGSVFSQWPVRLLGHMTARKEELVTDPVGLGVRKAQVTPWFGAVRRPMTEQRSSEVGDAPWPLDCTASASTTLLRIRNGSSVVLTLTAV